MDGVRTSNHPLRVCHCVPKTLSVQTQYIAYTHPNRVLLRVDPERKQSEVISAAIASRCTSRSWPSL